MDVDPVTLMPFTHFEFFSDSTAKFGESKSGHHGWEYYVKQQLPKGKLANGDVCDLFTHSQYFINPSGATMVTLTEKMRERITYWNNRKYEGGKPSKPVFVVMWSGNLERASGDVCRSHQSTSRSMHCHWAR